LGWDTFDLSLDIVVGADLTWRWKDQDHFELLQKLGIMTGEEAESVQRDAELVIGDIENSVYPFDRDWSDWRPRDDWALPSMPPDWAVL
jgi:predicted RNA-binding protein associated with RNAse of E/G family